MNSPVLFLLLYRDSGDDTRTSHPARDRRI